MFALRLYHHVLHTVHEPRARLRHALSSTRCMRGKKRCCVYDDNGVVMSLPSLLSQMPRGAQMHTIIADSTSIDNIAHRQTMHCTSSAILIPLLRTASSSMQAPRVTPIILSHKHKSRRLRSPQPSPERISRPRPDLTVVRCSWKTVHRDILAILRLGVTHCCLSCHERLRGAPNFRARGCAGRELKIADKSKTRVLVGFPPNLKFFP